MTNMDVARIGKCAGCEDPTHLKFELCSSCLPRYGPDMGLLFRKVRNIPEFARRCYSGISSEPHRRMFVQMFGNPSERELG